MRKALALLLASLIVMLMISLMFTSVASAQPPHGCENHESFSCTFGESPDPCDQFDGYQCDDGWSLNCDYACSVANHCNYFATALNCNEKDGWHYCVQIDDTWYKEWRDYYCVPNSDRCKFDSYMRMPCDDSNPCTTDGCSGGECTHANKPDKTSCGTAGVCCGGTCYDPGECCTDADCAADYWGCDGNDRVKWHCSCVEHTFYWEVIETVPCQEGEECVDGECIEVPEFPASVTAVFGATLFIFLIMRRKYVRK